MDVTLVSCTPDMTSELFRRHAETIRRTVTGCEHLVFDNHGGTDFNHSREINRAARIARGRYLVLLDDDVLVRNDWLGALVRAQQDTGAAVVGGIHRWADERINHTGGWVMWDGRGNHFDDPIAAYGYFPYVCSAVCLIDLAQIAKWGFAFDEGFRKYFQEVDFCMSVWEAGGTVVSTPECDVFHLVGQAMKARSDHKAVDQADKMRFIERWKTTGRLETILRAQQGRLRWGGIDDVLAYDDWLRIFERAIASNAVSDIEEALRTVSPYTCVGHAKHLSGVLEQRLSVARSAAAASRSAA
jgi:GT2 family glycosyltransferase